jgi:hypothetical protein
LKKAAQKLLFDCGVETGTAQMRKVFLLLFVHKKKPSLLPACGAGVARG